MSLSKEQRQEIKALISEKIEKKLKQYDRETASMPFLAKLIQDEEKVAAYSFIHSMATTLGMSIYEDVSVIIASETAEEAYRNCKIGGTISERQKTVISNIVSELRGGERNANIEEEIREVLKAPIENGKPQKSGSIADLLYEKRRKRILL